MLKTDNMQLKKTNKNIYFSIRRKKQKIRSNRLFFLYILFLFLAMVFHTLYNGEKKKQNAKQWGGGEGKKSTKDTWGLRGEVSNITVGDPSYNEKSLSLYMFCKAVL